MELNGNTPDYDGQHTKPVNYHTDTKIRLSIIIKALNEQAKIEAAIRSALASVRGIDAEVILADSLSTDDTVELAARYPIKIVQLINPRDRSCGIGPQLGFQFARGEYIYLMDGDMELNPDFARLALSQLDHQPDVAGIGGVVEEQNAANLIFELRKKSSLAHMRVGEVDRLNMGGLYRRAALEDVGYFSNRNLHSFEELELALRLRAKGWRLLRLPIVAIRHYGHTLPMLRLLGLRFRSGYVQGPGELLRSALGKPYLMHAIKEFRVFLGVIAWWGLLIISAALTPYSLLPLAATASLAIVAAIGMSWRKNSLKLGLYSIIDWNIFAMGTLSGFIRRQKQPDGAIPSKILQEAPADVQCRAP